MFPQDQLAPLHATREYAEIGRGIYTGSKPSTINCICFCPRHRFPCNCGRMAGGQYMEVHGRYLAALAGYLFLLCRMGLHKPAASRHAEHPALGGHCAIVFLAAEPQNQMCTTPRDPITLPSHASPAIPLVYEEKRLCLAARFLAGHILCSFLVLLPAWRPVFIGPMTTGAPPFSAVHRYLQGTYLLLRVLVGCQVLRYPSAPPSCPAI